MFIVLRSRWLVSKKKVTTRNGVITASTLEAAEATPKMLKRGQNAG